MKTIFDTYTDSELKEILQKIVSFIRNGRTLEFIKKNAPKAQINELISIAKAQIKNTKTTHQIYFSEEDLQFATPDMIAEYRAKKLKTDTIIELGCGIGLQTIAFAKECKKVIAIDIDKRKIAYAKKNISLLGISNVTFIYGDALDEHIIKQCKGDKVFLDPERKQTEKERTLATITPNIQKIIAAYKEIASEICIELPPQIQEDMITQEKIAFDEKEYISINGKINRLHIYIDNKRDKKEKKELITAVSLPSQMKLSSEDTLFKKKIVSAITKEYSFLAEIDEAVQKASLIDTLPVEGDLFIWKNKQFLILRKKEINPFLQPQSPFLKLHLFIDTAKNKEELILKLQKQDIGKILIRGSISNEEYWPFRKSIEQNLKGNKTAEVFIFSDYVITIPLKEDKEN